MSAGLVVALVGRAHPGSWQELDMVPCAARMPETESACPPPSGEALHWPWLETSRLHDNEPEKHVVVMSIAVRRQGELG